MTQKQITDRMIRIGLIVLPFFIFYGYRLMKGFEYPVVDDIMVNQTILSGDNMLLPYIGIMLSSALVFLQQLFTTWNVYFIFLALSFCLSFSVYLDSFFRKKLYFVLPLLVILQRILMKYFSFSVIAYLLSTAGILLLFDRKHIVGALLSLIGLSIRPQIIASLLLLLLPFLVFEVIKEKKKKELFVLSALILLIFASNKVYTLTKPDVQEYLTWNTLSTNLRDFPAIDYEKHAKEFQELGVSENDLSASTYWLFAEKDALNNELLTKIQSVRSFSEKYSFNVFQMVKDYFQNIILTTFLLVMVGWFLFFKPKKVYGWLLPLVPFALIGALFVRQRVVERVYIPIIVSFLIFFVYDAPLFYNKRKLLKERGIFYSLQLVGMLASMAWVNSVGQELYWFPIIQSSMISEYHDVVEKHSDKLLVFGGYGTLVNSQPSLATIRMKPDQLIENTTTLGNWQTFSPHYYQLMENYNVEDPSNLLSSALDKENILFFWSPSSGNMDRVKKIMKEHYQKDIYFEEVELVTSDMNLYRLRTGEDR